MTYAVGESKAKRLSSSPALPKSWPRHVLFLTRLQFPPSVSVEAVQSTLAPRSNQTLISNSVAGPCPLVRIQLITDAAHPAFGQYGLFATQRLPPDTFILSYLGLIHGAEDGKVDSDYDLCFDRERGIGIDAASMGNEARFINDYRGINSRGPNAEFRDFSCEVGGGAVEKRMGVFVVSAGKSGKRRKGIARGEEILVSYGKGFWQHREQAGQDVL